MPAPTKTKALYLALDACDEALVRRYIHDGDMPTLGRFFDAAATTPTEAPLGLFVSSMWPTLFTATTVARHGYHCWDKIEPGTYDRRETSPNEIRGASFWEMLSDAGHRVAVLDVPHSRVRRPIDGVMLVEWGCHDRHFGTHSWPESLVDEIAERTGPHPVGCAEVGRAQFAPCDWILRAGPHRTDEEHVELFDALLVGIDRKQEVSLELLARGGWDLFTTVFGEGHCVGHQQWHLSDPTHPWHDPVLAARLGDPVRRIYKRLDAAVAAHLELAGPDTTVFVHLSHGMAAHYDGTHLLPGLLHGLERHAEQGAPVGWRTRSARQAGARLPLEARLRLTKALSPLLRRRLAAAPPSPADEGDAEFPPGPERLWFVAPNNTVTGGIRLNLEGREPSGRVRREEFGSVCRWLRDELLQIVNIDTGERAVRAVHLTDDVYDRPAEDSLPDLLVEWNTAAQLERVWSPSIGTVVQKYDHWRTGDHTRAGFLAVGGPGVIPSRRQGHIDTVDIAPTIAASIGAVLPGVDGVPRTDLLPGGRPTPKPWPGPTPVEARGARVATTLRSVRGRLDGLLDAHHVTRVAAVAAGDDATSLRREVEELSTLRHEVDALRRRLAEVDLMSRVELAGLGGRTERLEHLGAATAWVSQIVPRDELLISVVMPTKDRVGRLREAIESVVAQRHSRWELLVVDDASSDGTAAYLRGLDDPRIRILDAPGVGCAAARNIALDACTGGVITYLDDDNLFHRDWLVAVSWMFHRLPDLRVAYGARVIEDEDHDPGRAATASGRPWIHLQPWDRDTIEQANILDMNVLAHRPSSARFDERIDYFGDWDLILKLSEDTEPTPIPVIAALYSTSATGRMTDVVSDEAKAEQVRLVREGIAARRRART